MTCELRVWPATAGVQAASFGFYAVAAANVYARTHANILLFVCARVCVCAFGFGRVLLWLRLRLVALWTQYLQQWPLRNAANWYSHSKLAISFYTWQPLGRKKCCSPLGVNLKMYTNIIMLGVHNIIIIHISASAAGTLALALALLLNSPLAARRLARSGNHLKRQVARSARSLRSLRSLIRSL